MKQAPVVVPFLDNTPEGGRLPKRGEMLRNLNSIARVGLRQAHPKGAHELVLDGVEHLGPVGQGDRLPLAQPPEKLTAFRAALS